eukprot:2075891-Pyramimonas_sp.AAC.1
MALGFRVSFTLSCCTMKAASGMASRSCATSPTYLRPSVWTPSPPLCSYRTGRIACVRRVHKYCSSK